jgi:hypothetical protein
MLGSRDWRRASKRIFCFSADDVIIRLEFFFSKAAALPHKMQDVPV